MSETRPFERFCQALWLPPRHGVIRRHVFYRLFKYTDGKYYGPTQLKLGFGYVLDLEPETVRDWISDLRWFTDVRSFGRATVRKTILLRFQLKAFNLLLEPFVRRVLEFRLKHIVHLKKANPKSVHYGYSTPKFVPIVKGEKVYPEIEDLNEYIKEAEKNCK